jgi:hypothetical protein
MSDYGAVEITWGKAFSELLLLFYVPTIVQYDARRKFVSS